MAPSPAPSFVGYGVFRFLAEFFRTPDAGIFGLSYVVSMGQWLSLPMIVAGGWLLFRARRTTRTSQRRITTPDRSAPRDKLAPAT